METPIYHIYKPYITWVFMGYIIPKNPKVEHKSLDIVLDDFSLASCFLKETKHASVYGAERSGFK